MNTSDKTGEKLVQSIRKTKSSGTASRTRTSRTKASASADKTPVEKSPVATATEAAPVRKPRAKRKTADARTDLYQSGRRVWPD
jgi:hypothetical protein